MLRSAQLPESNKFRPERGLRYDGLYCVREYKCVDEEKAMYRFVLVRCEGQEEIRCAKGAAKRPTKNELMEWEKLRGRTEWV